jgi:hypothetical protein
MFLVGGNLKGTMKNDKRREKWSFYASVAC